MRMKERLAEKKRKREQEQKLGDFIEEQIEEPEEIQEPKNGKDLSLNEVINLVDDDIVGDAELKGRLNGIRLSHSTQQLWHSCEQKYHLKRQIYPTADRDQTGHTVFGNAVEAGFLEWLRTGDEDKARIALLLGYEPYLTIEGQNPKNLERAASSLTEMMDKWPADEWEVAYFNGRPATQLGFKIILNEASNDYYCGYVDVVLKHIQTGVYAICDVKTTTTGFQQIEALFKYSNQALTYSCVLDAIAGKQSAFSVLYLVVRMKKGLGNFIPEVHLLPFNQTALNRLEALLQVQIDYERIKEHKDMNFFPRRDSACTSYFRVCEYYETCGLNYSREDRVDTYETEDWDFVFRMDELLEQYQVEV